MLAKYNQLMDSSRGNKSGWEKVTAVHSAIDRCTVVAHYGEGHNNNQMGWLL